MKSLFFAEKVFESEGCVKCVEEPDLVLRTWLTWRKVADLCGPFQVPHFLRVCRLGSSKTISLRRGENCYLISDYEFGVSTSSGVKIPQIPQLPLKFSQFTHTQIYMARNFLYICTLLTLILLTWRMWWDPNNASKWQMGFNLAFKELIIVMISRILHSVWNHVHDSSKQDLHRVRYTASPFNFHNPLFFLKVFSIICSIKQNLSLKLYKKNFLNLLIY